MHDLELLDADVVGLDPMDLVRALPGVLRQTGAALDKRPAAVAPAPAAPPPAPAPPPLDWKWKAAGAAAVLLVFGLLLKR